MHSTADNRKPAVLSGRSVVLGMFAFGIAATGLLWGYWHFHTAPFRQLQVAIAREFAESIPRVDGGQRKLHKGGSKRFRIVMRVGFDPGRDDARAQQVAERVLQLAEQHQGLAAYDVFELHLFHGVPEEEIRQRTIEIPLRSPNVEASQSPADTAAAE